MLAAKKENLIKSRLNAKVLALRVIKEPCYLIKILDYFSITELMKTH
jgi:hypothetical protein